jgi:vacuolar protein sorting-associated protein 3
MKMVTSYLDQMFSFLDDPSVLKLWRAKGDSHTQLQRPIVSSRTLKLKAASYASSPNDATFLSYFAATSPDSEHKRVRLKTMLLLQGALAYDTLAVRQRLLDRRKLLAFELAIVEGKVTISHTR